MTQYLFELPDKGHLSYAFPWDLKQVGSQFKWYRSFYDFRVVHKTNSKKSHSPRLGLWSSRTNQKLICADFDKLPKGYTRWSAFEKDLRTKYSNDFVFQSISGKVKVLFLVELKTSYINSKIAKYILSKLLPAAWFDAVDKSSFGMSITYLNPIIVAALRKFLESNPKPRKLNLAPLFAKRVEGHHFDMHKGTLPKYMQRFIRGNKNKEHFIRMLVRQRRMAMKGGFDIPTTKFAQEVGVGQKTIHRWRQELIELGFIKCVDKEYKINKKAQTFKAICLFKQTVIRIFTSKKTKKISQSTKKFISLPTQIEDGNWHQTIWEYSKYFFKDRQQEFIQWVNGLPNSQLNNRCKKALWALRSRLRYNDLPHTHLVI